LIVLVLFVIQSQAPPSLPATYKGLSLSTPAPVGDAQFPPIWLIIQGKAISGTLLRSQLASGQEYGTHGDAHLERVELTTAGFSAGEPVVIVGSRTITGLEAEFVELPLDSSGRSLKAEGKTEGNAAVFRLEQSGYTSGQFLRVSISFREGEASGNVEYIWQLIPRTQAHLSRRRSPHPQGRYLATLQAPRLRRRSHWHRSPTPLLT